MDALPLRESDHPESETTAGARVRPRGTVSGGVPLLRETPNMLSVPKSSAGIGHGVIIKLNFGIILLNLNIAENICIAIPFPRHQPKNG